MTEIISTPDDGVEVALASLLAELNPKYADFILVEGFKTASIPKIEVFRKAMGKPLLANSVADIIAVASDVQLDITMPILDLNNITQIADFIMLKILKSSI